MNDPDAVHVVSDWPRVIAWNAPSGSLTNLSIFMMFIEGSSDDWNERHGLDVSPGAHVRVENSAIVGSHGHAVSGDNAHIALNGCIVGDMAHAIWTGNGGRLDLTDCDVLGDGLAWGVYTTEEATVRIEGSSIQNGICVSGNVLAFTGNKVGSANIRANAVFKNNTFFHGGVTVFEGSPVFEDNVFEESPVTIGDSARAEFRRNRFTGESQFQNFGRMMVNGPDAVVVLEQNDFVDCQGDVLIGGNGCTIEARGNLFARNSGPVIVVDSTYGLFQDNTIQHNESPCALLIKGDSAPAFIGNKVDANSGIGIGVSATAPSRIERNVITGNQTGVMVQSATSVTLTGNQIAGNEDVGVFFRADGRGTMVDNTITGNKMGVLVIDEAYVELTNNRVCDNHEDGVHCERGGWVKATGNTFASNPGDNFSVGPGSQHLFDPGQLNRDNSYRR